MFTGNTFENNGHKRKNLGEDVPVLAYRMMQRAMFDTLSHMHGREKACSYFRQAGVLTGQWFADYALDLGREINDFLADLQKKLREMKIGILRIEHFDQKTGEVTMTLSEDVSSSGLSNGSEAMCSYHEGFFAGIFGSYMGMKYDVRELEYWVNDNRVSRLVGVPNPQLRTLCDEKVNDREFC